MDRVYMCKCMSCLRSTNFINRETSANILKGENGKQLPGCPFSRRKIEQGGVLIGRPTDRQLQTSDGLINCSRKYVVPADRAAVSFG